jgi:hypothetical protein
MTLFFIITAVCTMVLMTATAITAVNCLLAGVGIAAAGSFMFGVLTHGW